ncbi:MAG: hypothetical protein AAFV43_10430 [Planctomycetota bacterium]
MNAQCAKSWFYAITAGSMRRSFATATAVLFVSNVAALSLYQVGNSFTLDTLQGGTEAMLEQRLGVDVSIGYHARGNSTLDRMWNDPTASGTVITEQYGYHDEALPNNSWDYLTLQTFPSIEFPTLSTEVARIQDFVGAADVGSGGTTEVIVYGPWAGRADSAWNLWESDVLDSPDQLSIYAEDYHDLLYDSVAELFPGRTRLASAGKVIWEMRQRIDAGDAPLSFTGELYRDTIHMSRDVGRFVASTVIQTSILGRSQVGQNVTRDVGNWDSDRLTTEVANWIQLVTWEVMLADPRSRVAAPDPGDYDGNGTVDFGDLLVFESTYGSTERLLADGDGDGVVDLGDFFVWEAAAPIVAPEGRGDYDGNGRVDYHDIALLEQTFGSITELDADGNGDGVIDLADYNAWRDSLARLGDYNGNHLVEFSDYDVFAGTFGSSEFLLADGNLDGVVDIADYTVWRDRVLPGLQDVGPTAIPEPAALLLAAVGGLVGVGRRSVV